MSIKQKIKNLWKNHKEEIIAGGVILGCVGVGVALDHFEKESKVETIEPAPSPAPSPAPKLPEWDSRYMKNWNTMLELAQRLELEPGESYVIDDAGLSKMSSGVIIGNGNNAIAHYIDGHECYPDEDWWESYINGDTTFTGDDKYSKLNRFVYMMNNADFKPGDMFTYGRKSNGDYFMGFDNFTDSEIEFFKY